MPEIIAHTADGIVLHFPEGTDPAIIQGAIKQHINQVMQPPGPPSFDTQKARNASAVKPIGPTGSPTGYLFGNPQSVEDLRNNVVDKARFILPPLAGAAAATAAAPSAPFTLGAGPIAAGIGANSAIDFLLKQLQSGDKLTADELKDSLKQGTLNEVGGRLLTGALKAGSAFRNAGVPDAASMAILKPTAGQMANSPFLKWVEKTLAPGSKAAAADRSARAGSQVGFNLAGKEAGRSATTVQDPNTMVKLITGELVPEESVGAQKILQRTADYQPIKITPNETTPGHYATGINTSNFDPKLSINQNLAQNPIPLTQTQVTSSGVTQVPIPGAYEIIPGVVKKVPFATDPASLKALMDDPVRLQDALTKSQAAGVGYNVRQDIAGLKIARIQQAATTVENGKMRINTDALENEFNTATKQGADAAESNRIIFKGSKNLSTIKQFYTNLAQTQDKPSSIPFRNMMIKGDAFILGMGMMHAAFSGGSLEALGPAAGFVGIQLGAAGLASLLTKETSGRIMLALANKSAVGVSDAYAGRMLMKGLSGTVNYLVHSDGSKTPVQFGPGGEPKVVGQ